MITRAQRVAAGLLGVVFGVLALAKLVDADGYALELASFSLVNNMTAWESGTLLAAVEACAALLLLLVAVSGRHALVAFQGGTLLATSASLAYAILVVDAFYEGHDLEHTALFGTLLRHAPRSPYVVVEVLALLSFSAWLLTSAFLTPAEAGPHRPRRRRAKRRADTVRATSGRAPLMSAPPTRGR